MAKQTLVNLELLSTHLDKLNSNFTELYDWKANLSGGNTFNWQQQFNVWPDIVAANSHIRMYESDNSNKQWNIEVNSWKLVFTEAWVAERMVIDSNLTFNWKINATRINFSWLPTSPSWLSSWDVWNDWWTLKIV